MAWLILLSVIALPLVVMLMPAATAALRILVACFTGHDDGTPHVFAEVLLGRHACEAMSYCHHYRERCECGTERVRGYVVEEVR